MTPAVSVCMIVRNEECELARSVDSVRDVADELIVVDTGSTDRTPAVAESLGAKLDRFDFSTTDFAAARNRSIALASGRWILVIDADESLDPAGVPAIQALVAAGENAGYFLERRNEFATGENPVTDYVVRFFPNRPDYRYRGRVHETVDASILSGGGHLHKTDIVLHHRFSDNPQLRRAKNLRYIEILKEELDADPGDDSRLDFLAAEYHQLGMYDEAALIAERITRVRPLDARAHLFAGVYHLLYQANPAKGRAAFHQALNLRPGYAEAEWFLRLADEQFGVSSNRE